jgi:hypothetical protein
MLAFAGYVSVDLGFRVPFAPEVSSLYAHDAAVEKGPMLGMLIPIALIEVVAGAQQHTAPHRRCTRPLSPPLLLCGQRNAAARTQQPP